MNSGCPVEPDFRSGVTTRKESDKKYGSTVKDRQRHSLKLLLLMLLLLPLLLLLLMLLLLVLGFKFGGNPLKIVNNASDVFFNRVYQKQIDYIYII